MASAEEQGRILRISYSVFMEYDGILIRFYSRRNNFELLIGHGQICSQHLVEVDKTVILHICYFAMTLEFSEHLKCMLNRKTEQTQSSNEALVKLYFGSYIFVLKIHYNFCSLSISVDYIPY